MLRRIAVVSLLCLASAIASVWQPAPRTPRSVTNIVKIVPAIFTTSFAQAPVTTSCSGTPTPNDPLLGGQSGVLAIQMNSLKLVSSTSTEVSLLSSPKDLNFGLSSGSSAGSFASNVAISAGTYVQLKAVMDNTFRIMCAVTCDTDGAGPIASRTFVTKGGSAITTPDGVGGAASQSSLPIASSPQELPPLPLTPPIVVTPNSSAQINMGFTAAGACELWDISTLLGHALGTDFKILPKSLSASIVQ